MTSTSTRLSWMNGVDRNTKLNRLTIPGTHDSGTWLGSGYDRCQNVGYLEQLRSGVRFLDIRLRYMTSRRGGVNFTVHHSSDWMQSYFDRDSDYSNDPNCQHFVLQDCLQFLAENDSECVIMCIKDEYDPEGVGVAAFESAFRTLVQKNGREADYFWVENRVPTLAEAKGRIVLVSRLSSAAWRGSYGILWPAWDKGLYQTDGVDVEDHYMDVTTAAKWGKVKDHLDKASGKVRNPAGVPYGQDRDDFWYITFVSCAPGNASPESWANTMNPLLRGYLADAANAPGRHTRLGTILMDFPPQDVIDQIWQYAQQAYP